jgi:uncharacterized repeat protein (TIGR03803 family)
MSPKSFFKRSLPVLAVACSTFVLNLRAAPPVYFQYAKIIDLGGDRCIASSGLTAWDNGKMFGTTYGGAYNDFSGCVYEIKPEFIGTQLSYSISTSYKFYSSDSPQNDIQQPYANLSWAPDRVTLYGTATGSGTGNAGGIFQLNVPQAEAGPMGAGYTILHYFDGMTEGGNPRGQISVGCSGSQFPSNLFMCLEASDDTNYHGGLLMIDPLVSPAVSTPIIRFPASGIGNPFGRIETWETSLGGSRRFPQPKITNALSSIVIYGAAKTGGSNNAGAVFKINGDGTGLQQLHAFGAGSTDGTAPEGGVLLVDSMLYGTTSAGGSNFGGTVYCVNTNGTGYKVLANFNYSTTGSSPQCDLIERAGVLYGTTYVGGTNGGGSVFAVNTNGSNFMILHSFLSPGYDGNGHYTNTDGGWSVTSLVVSSNSLFGTTAYGGTNGVGTVFQITLPPLPPRPFLRIRNTTTNLNLSWSATLTNYTLQQIGKLGGASWSNYPGNISSDGTNNSVSIPPAFPFSFFRLFGTNGP